MSSCVMNLPLMLSSWIGIDLKRRMFSVIAISVGRRSMLEAPKKPTTPVGVLENVLRVLGLGDRAAVAEARGCRG